MDVPEIWRREFRVMREVEGRGLCGVQRFIYTSGLLTELRFNGLYYDYAARYCYPSAREAVEALLAWDGAGDPPGEWIKEKVSERGNPNLQTEPGDFTVVKEDSGFAVVKGTGK